jgi:soluble lytic murein transglycosylase
MKQKWMVAALAVGMFIFGVGAPRAAGTNFSPTSGRAAELKTQLAETRAALDEARKTLAETTEANLYQEALELGIVDAVKQTKLPARQQRRIAIAIVREAKKNELDPLLVVALIRAESSFNNYAVSNVGAMGLMQVMPATGEWLAKKNGYSLGRKQHLFDSELNLELGTQYLASLISSFKSLEDALVAYNAGPSNARKIIKNAQAREKFVRGYPRKVVSEFQRLRATCQQVVAERAKCIAG